MNDLLRQLEVLEQELDPDTLDHTLADALLAVVDGISKRMRGVRARRRITQAAKKEERRRANRHVRAQSGIRLLRRDVPLLTNGVDTVKFATAQHCYVCKQSFREAHFFYDRLCPACASLNFEKRTQTADLSGCVALVTGGRVKIGFQTALKLLFNLLGDGRVRKGEEPLGFIRRLHPHQAGVSAGQRHRREGAGWSVKFVGRIFVWFGVREIARERHLLVAP